MDELFKLNEKGNNVEINITGIITVRIFLDELKDFFRNNDLGYRVFILKDV